MRFWNLSVTNTLILFLLLFIPIFYHDYYIIYVSKGYSIYYYEINYKIQISKSKNAKIDEVSKKFPMSSKKKI